MSVTVDRVLEGAGRRLGGLRLRRDEPVPGIGRVVVSSRLTRANGMEVALYLVGPVLIDSGFVHARAVIEPFFAARRLAAVCLTHHHEDHAGTCGALAARHGCPVYLRAPERRHEEGLARLRPYRRLWWGEPLPYAPVALPEVIAAGAHVLRAVPIPGHSATHTAFFDERTGVVFAGDLFVSGGATAVMSHENPYESVASLRRVADLEPEWMLTGHALALGQPAAALRRKADAIAAAAAHAVAFHRAGLPVPQIVRRVFRRGRGTDLFYATLTSAEFSRACFVRAAVRFAPADGDGAAAG